MTGDEIEGSSTILDDEQYLRRAIQLAAEAREAGDPPYGSLLVDALGVVLAEERNTVITSRDITAHPELKLARWTGREMNPAEATHITMFTSCEPCPMCANVIARAKIGRVVYALSSEQLQSLKSAGQRLPDSAIIDYHGPQLYEEARVPLEGYYSDQEAEGEGCHADEQHADRVDEQVAAEVMSPDVRRNRDEEIGNQA